MLHHVTTPRHSALAMHVMQNGTLRLACTFSFQVWECSCVSALRVDAWSSSPHWSGSESRGHVKGRSPMGVGWRGLQVTSEQALIRLKRGLGGF